MSSLAQSLVAFVQSDLLRGRGLQVDLDTYLFDEGMVDSLGILRLLAFLELEIGRQIADHEVVMAHFRTIRTIASTFDPDASQNA